ncbi:MAG: YgjP-like metallopeptidase domain-containing protein [Methanoregula sp.]
MLAQPEAVHLPYTVSHRNVKHPRLEFRTGTLLVVLPHGQDEKRVLNKHRQWIDRKYQFIHDVIDTSATLTLESRTREELRALVKESIKKYSEELGCAPDHLFIKKMCTKWASCSRKGNLTINSLGQYLPDDLVEYVVFHEMVHLINPNHDQQFWKCIRKKFNNTSEIEKSLCTYWFRIQKVS